LTYMVCRDMTMTTTLKSRHHVNNNCPTWHTTMAPPPLPRSKRETEVSFFTNIGRQQQQTTSWHYCHVTTTHQCHHWSTGDVRRQQTTTM
jgi:hypothetical protein